jgi:hypothetical protein
MIFDNRFHEEEPPDADVEQLWQIEILRRAHEIDEGSVQLVPWSELRSRLMKTSLQ